MYRNRARSTAGVPEARQLGRRRLPRWGFTGQRLHAQYRRERYWLSTPLPWRRAPCPAASQAPSACAAAPWARAPSAASKAPAAAPLPLGRAPCSAASQAPVPRAAASRARAQLGRLSGAPAIPGALVAHPAYFFRCRLPAGGATGFVRGTRAFLVSGPNVTPVKAADGSTSGHRSSVCAP